MWHSGYRLVGLVPGGLCLGGAGQGKDPINSAQGVPITPVTVVIPITTLTVVATLAQH